MIINFHCNEPAKKTPLKLPSLFNDIILTADRLCWAGKGNKKVHKFPNEKKNIIIITPK